MYTHDFKSNDGIYIFVFDFAGKECRRIKNPPTEQKVKVFPSFLNYIVSYYI